jgi:Rieske Fe-S protein
MIRSPLSRRSFCLKTLGLIGAAAALKSSGLLAATASDSSLLSLSQPQDTASAETVPLTYLTDKQAKKIAKVGDSEVFKLNKQKILFIRTSERNVDAVSAVCTHEGCTVAYREKDDRITCWCHSSAFELSGKVIKGPAQRDLTRYKVVTQDGKIGVAL